MHVLSVSQERALKKGLKVVNGNYENARTLANLASRFERMQKQAHGLGLKLIRSSPESQNATLYHLDCDVKTVLIDDAPLEAIDSAMCRIFHTEAMPNQPQRYTYSGSIHDVADEA